MKIKKNDRVIVLAGKDKGRTGTVVKAMPSEARVVVDGINMVTRHTRPSARSEGGQVRKPAPIHVSNVALVDPKDGKATRVAVKTLADGQKVRVSKRSGEQI